MMPISGETIDLSPFKMDIDELIQEFDEGEFTTLVDMKRIWMSRKFSFIYEARPCTRLAFFMQSLFAHTIGYMVRNDSLSQRLGGLYCLYCLYETQPYKPPFKIYLSAGELKRLKSLVADAKQQGVKVGPALVKKMLKENMFLFGFVDLNEGKETVNQLTELQNARLKFLNEKLFSDKRIEQFVHMDMGMEFDLNVLKKMSTDYSEAKKQAITEANEVVDVQNIQHITDEKELIGDVVERITEDWKFQRDMFYQQTGLNRYPTQAQQQQFQKHEPQEDKDDDDDSGGGGDDDFLHELELQLSE